MKKELFTFTGTAGNSLSAVIWLPEKTPKLLFQITHGMTEHMGRYERLAEKLTEQGIVTAGFDLPGHGRTRDTRTVHLLVKHGGHRPLPICRHFRNS